MSAPSIEQQTLALLAQAFTRHAAPRVRALHLPPARPEDSTAGESCAVELDDGSMGLSYVLYGQTLPALRLLQGAKVGQAALAGADALALLQGCLQLPTANEGVPRTLGFAVLNALAAHLMRRAGWRPPDAPDSIAGLDPQPGEHIGMVGFFKPLFKAVRERGARLTVLELREDLLGEHEGVQVTADPQMLTRCDKVLATGTLLLNGSLPGLLALAKQARRFALVGPSAGALPDALFAAGVTDLAGAWVEDGPGFAESLRCGEARGKTARKFLIRAGDWPGVGVLMN
jgi:uncharacterized protein (DUF4213/DUF364 family)